MEAIEFQDFSCYYKNKKETVTALDNLTMSIEKGELFVILGQSGSGKTTLLKCILGLCDYISGALYIEGVPADQLLLSQSNIGFVRQEINLYPHLTIYENIAFPLRTMKTPQAEVDRRVREMASLLGLRPLLTRKPKQLSGGQHQRVAIARALIKNPTLLLMDEPFSNVDAALRSQMRQLIKKIHETYHCTIVFVTHDLVEAFTLADRIMVLEDGKLQLLGQPQALIGDLERMGYSLPQPTGYSL